MKKWSKLQKELYLIIDPTIDFQIHCVAYPMRSRYGNTALPRYWITLGKEIIFDYPKQFLSPENYGKIYYGIEPEFEESAEFVCDGFNHLLEMLSSNEQNDILTNFK